MRRNFKKGLVGIIVLFIIGMGIAPSIGGYNEDPTNVLMGSFDPSCYPVLNGTIGENDWYVSCVTITFIYDPQETAAVYFIIDDEEETLYTEPFEVYEDGYHELSWRTVDHEGKWSDPASTYFKIDQTPPEINLTWEPIDINHILFTANCNDACSGMDRVEFALNDEPAYIDSTEPYEWLIYYLWPNYIYKSTAFDNAGNSAFDILDDSDIYSNEQMRAPQQLLSYFFNIVIQLLYMLSR